MYKRLIFVLLLLLLCIGISVGSFFAVNKMSSKLTSDLEKFQINAESNNVATAVEAIDACIENLERYEKIYAVFLDHNIFENIMITIPSIKYLYETGNSDEAMDKCFESIETLRIVVHEQKLTFENVF